MERLDGSTGRKGLDERVGRHELLEKLKRLDRYERVD